MVLNKNIFLLWLQGWDSTPWLNKQIAQSWEINNPTWKVHYVDLNNLKTYVQDIDFIYDPKKNISPQAKSDIIRLSLLKNHGGVWADATLLCMQPLDHWIFEAVEPSGLWMYHGHGGCMKKEIGPASWFIVSKDNDYMITKWKEGMDIYWKHRISTWNYFWMDNLFRCLFNTDKKFRELWLKCPYLYCELDGQSHTLAHHGMQNNTPSIKKLFLEKPPYVLKFWRRWDNMFPNVETEKCKKSNGYYAIEMSKRKFCFKHQMA